MTDTPIRKRPSELATRTLAGLGMVTLAIVALALGGFAFWLLAVVAGVFMMAEWSDLHAAEPKTKRLGQYVLFVPLAIMCPIAAGPNFFALGLLIGAFFFLTIVTRRPQLGLGSLGHPGLRCRRRRCRRHGSSERDDGHGCKQLRHLTAATI